MTLFIDVQGVPNAILDLVKARIMANRKRNKERASAATAVKPEQPARRRYYSPVAPDRRPEPAGIPLGVPGWLLVPSDNELNAKVRELPAFRFVQEIPGNEPFIFAASGGPGGQPYLEGAPNEVTSQADGYIIPRKRPASGAITEECFFYLSSSDDGSGENSAFVSTMLIQFANFYVQWLTIRNTTISRVVREIYVQSLLGLTEDYLYYASTYDAFDAPFFEDAIVDNALTAYGWHHAACVVQESGSSVTASFYLDGTRVLSTAPQPSADFWVQFEERDRISFTSRAFNIQTSLTSHRIAGIRYTERALYTGDTYTPPTSITRLA